MRKITFILAVTALLAASCTGSKKQEDAAIAKEVTMNDSISQEVEKANAEIQESINKADSLVNNL
jgi:uncharacterized protein YcfL